MVASDWRRIRRWHVQTIFDDLLCAGHPHLAHRHSAPTAMAHNSLAMARRPGRACGLFSRSDLECAARLGIRALPEPTSGRSPAISVLYRGIPPHTDRFD